MKSITATKFRQGNMEAAYNTVCAHSPVTIISKDRPDITMVLATDYEEMKLELELAKSKPMQPLIDGRFKENKIVSYCLDNDVNMNKLAVMSFTQEDREQFYQLIGYSLGGYADLSQVSDESYDRAANN
jgi:PHD/YefM family antitoxin component YafN of YafNO toxin-antitoxin module